MYFTRVVNIGPDYEEVCKQTWIRETRDECSQILQEDQNITCPIFTTICGQRHTTSFQEAYWEAGFEFMSHK